jgi:very-short-patch-repair endonuclease
MSRNKSSLLKKFKIILKANQTDCEQILWYHLRNRQFEGFKFRRQHVLLGSIVDFVCLEKKLIIELDGGQHTEQITYDLQKTIKLENDGYHIIRFWNNEITENLEEVLDTIFYNIMKL